MLSASGIAPSDGVLYKVLFVPVGLADIYQGKTPLLVGDLVYMVETPGGGYGMHNLFYRPATHSLHPISNQEGEYVMAEPAADEPIVRS